MDYNYIISDALRTTWQHKKLWLWGMLFMFFSGGGVPSFNYSQPFPTNPEDVENLDPTLMLEQLQSYLWLIGLTMAILFLVLIAGFFLRPFLESAIVDMTHTARSSSDPIRFRAGVDAGKRYIWRVLGHNLLLGLPLMLLIGLMLIPFIGVFGVLIAQLPELTAGGTVSPEVAEELATTIATAMGGFIAVFCLLFCILFPLGLLFSVLRVIDVRGIVLQDMGIIDSIKHGFGVVRNNFGAVLAMWFIMLVLSMVMSFVIGLPLIFIVMPLTLIVMSGGLTGINIALIIVMGLAIAAFNVVLGGIIQTFTQTAWTRWYEQITDIGPKVPEAANVSGDPSPSTPELIEVTLE